MRTLLVYIIMGIAACVNAATLTAEHPELVGSFLKNFAACQPAVWQ